MKKFSSKITSKSIEQSGLPSKYSAIIAEYIWNGFDANATAVEINYESNEVGFLESFSISDNGSGICLSNLEDTFGQFLDSQKRNSYDINCHVKGKAGKGRYSFINFCDKAIWETVFEAEDKKLIEYEIIISKDTLKDFTTDKESLSKEKKTGTTVKFESFTSLTGDILNSDDFENALVTEFGWFLFLNKERGYKIKVNGVEIDYMSIIADSDSYEEYIGEYTFKINYIRWKKIIGDRYSFYYFIDDNQISNNKSATKYNNKGNGFYHSVFVTSDYFKSFKITKTDDPTFEFDGNNQSDKTYKKLIKCLDRFLDEKQKLFIREFRAEELIDKFNKTKVFPDFKSNEYDVLRKKDLETVVKGIYCAQPKIFQGLKLKQSQTLVGFLNLLLDTEQRENILGILESVVDLTDEERKELSETLEKTKISSILELVNMLERRFKVVSTLKALVFDFEKHTNERDHIQKVIEENFWLFGEQYHLVSADKNMETVLNNLLSFVEGKKKDKTILVSKDKLKRPDIFISRSMQVPDPSSDEHMLDENIIVELKRASIVIGKDQFDQIEDYIRIINEEPQFNSKLYRWKLILVGKSVDDRIEDKYESQKGKGKKFLVESVRNYEIYAMTWADLFKTFELKHKHLIDKLEFKNSVVEDLEGRGIVLEKDMPDALVNEIAS